MTDFERALAVTLQFEGGYVDHPKDPGGATNRGVTTRVFHEWLRSQGSLPRDVRTITDAEIHAIYLGDYWRPAGCDGLAWPLSLVMFDAAVNLGTRHAVRALQRGLGVPDDGVIGPVTLDAIQAGDAKELAARALWERLRRYKDVSGGKLSVFLRGWLSRTLTLWDEVRGA